MNIVKRDHFLVPSWFDKFFNIDLLNDSSFFSEGPMLPKVNVVETDREVRIEMAVPGMRKEDFKVELNDHILTISSERTEDIEENADDKQFRRREFSHVSFSRSLPLPDTVETEKIKAKYEDGILRIHVPKKKGLTQKPLKTIRIS